MSYYTALQTAWATSTAAAVSNTVTGVNGVAGQSLNGLTTNAKINAVNLWTVTGTIPTSFYVSGAQLENCVNYAEFAALTTAQQINLEALFNAPGPLLGGSGNTSLIVDGEFLAYFNHSGPTIAALTLLANSQVQLWWGVSVAQGGAGLSSPVGINDITAVGLS